MSCISTFTKKKVDPTNLTADDVDIVDIAHALSLMCRANGHFPYFYSVGQHCVNCMAEAAARGYSERVQLGCLLHDASEAYLADITRPVKAVLEKYLSIEEKVQAEIFNKWISPPLDENEIKLVFDVDNAMLYQEFLTIMGEEISEEKPIVSAPMLNLLEFGCVKSKFIRAFEDLTSAPSKLHVGVDWLGEKQGNWIAAEVVGTELSYRLFSDIPTLCSFYEDVSNIIIDAPVGLPENTAEAEKRQDKTAREYLKIAARKSSVFPVPYRQLIYAKNKKEIWDLSRELGAKLTPMGIGIFECVRQVDSFLANSPEWKERLVESHPECAFQALNGGNGLIYSKHTDEGRLERIDILKNYVSNIESVVCSAPSKLIEDLLDAACLAVTSRRGYEPLCPAVYRDSRGIPMRIVVSKY